MKCKELLESIEFTEKDQENIRSVANFVEDHGYEIIDSVISVISKDPRIIEILQENNLSIPAAKEAWFYWLKLLFFSQYDDEFLEKIRQIGMTHVDANVSEDIVARVTFLFSTKTLSLLHPFVKENYFDISASVSKLFMVSLIAMIDSYREELLQSFLQFTGLREALFYKAIKEARKKRAKKG